MHAMTDVVKGRGSDVIGQQTAAAQQTQNEQRRGLPRPTRAHQRHVWSERQLLRKPSAEYKGGHQMSCYDVDIETEYEKRPYVRSELRDVDVWFRSLRQPHILQVLVRPRERHENPILIWPLLRVVGDSVLVHGEQRFRRVGRVLDHFHERAVLQLREINFDFGKTASRRIRLGIVYWNGAGMGKCGKVFS